MNESVIPILGSNIMNRYDYVSSTEARELIATLTAMDGITATISRSNETDAIALLVVRVNTADDERVLKVRRTNTHWVTDGECLAPNPWSKPVTMTIQGLWRANVIGNLVGFDMISELWAFIRAWVLMTVRAQSPEDRSSC